MAPRKRARESEGGEPGDAEGDEAGAPPQAQEQQQQQQQEGGEALTEREQQAARIARQRAAHFAHFKADDDEEDGEGNVHVGGNEARTLGPWSSAVELVNARQQAAAEREERIAQAAREANEAAEAIEWEPAPRSGRRLAQCAADAVGPKTLTDVCLGLLTEYVDCVESLQGVPDSIKVRLAATVCARRKLSPEVAALFAGFAGEVVFSDCTQLDAKAMAALLRACVGPTLERLELGSCGRGLGDEAAAVLEDNGPLPRLESVVFGGAYRLSDAGLLKVLRAAPGLMHLSLPQCCRLTGAVLDKLPDLAPKISHLNLQDCRGIGADALRSALPKMPSLRSLVLDGLSEVDDAVVKALAAAPELHEVSLNMCGGVGDEGLEALAAGCPQLEALHLDECKRVTDRGLAAVADGCRGLRALSVRRCAKLSDDVLALVATRGTLQSLCVNAVPSVSSKTMRALALYCRESLTSLDVSFCRRVPEKGLGLVADRCSRLTKLQLFGCSQVGRLFLDGHSNANLTDVLGFGTAASHMRP